MLQFYDVDPKYAEYLRGFEQKIPNIRYEGNDKFVCGIVLTVGRYNYFAPISSNKIKQRTNFLILDENGQVLSSIKFCFMFPAPSKVVTLKDFDAVRETDPAYANLLEKEFDFCRKHELEIRAKAEKIYKIGCNPNHRLYDNCCDFQMLETKQNEWVSAQK